MHKGSRRSNLSFASQLSLVAAELQGFWRQNLLPAVKLKKGEKMGLLAFNKGRYLCWGNVAFRTSLPKHATKLQSADPSELARIGSKCLAYIGLGRRCKPCSPSKTWEPATRPCRGAFTMLLPKPRSVHCKTIPSIYQMQKRKACAQVHSQTTIVHK
jgi:hypothetical protein